MIPYTPHKYIFGIPLYMIMTTLGWLVGYYIILKEAQRLKKSKKNLTIIYFSTLLSAPIIGRLFFFLGPWRPESMPAYNYFNLTIDGYVFYGMFIGGILGLIISSRILKQDIWEILDIFSIATSIGMFFGRIGCFFAGCCNGHKTDFPIALDVINRDYSRYPTQTISSFYNLLIFIFLTKFKFKKRFNGQVALLFFMIYSTCRFLIEFLRNNSWTYFGLSASQYISTILFITSFIIYKKKTAK